MNGKRIFLLISVLAGVGFFAYWRLSNDTQDTRYTNLLIIGIAADYAPYVSINQQGDYEGFDIDVAKAVAQALNKQLVLRDCGSMAPLFMSLQQGSVDALLWGISITPERQQKVDFVHYVGENVTSYPLILWQQPARSITSFNDLAGMRICAEPSSVQASVLDHYRDSIEIIPTERVDDAFLMLQQHKVDGALVDPAIAHKFKRAYSNLVILEIPLAPEDVSFGMGIALKKGNDAFKKELSFVINQLKETGIIAELKKKWEIE